MLARIQVGIPNELLARITALHTTHRDSVRKGRIALMQKDDSEGNFRAATKLYQSESVGLSAVITALVEQGLESGDPAALMQRAAELGFGRGRAATYTPPTPRAVPAQVVPIKGKRR